MDKDANAMSCNEFAYEYSKMIMREDHHDSSSSYRNLACSLVDALMTDEEKNVFKLHILANGGCASPGDIIKFSDISVGNISKVEKVVAEWLTFNRGELLQQAQLNDCFDENFKYKIADAAWRNKVC